MSYYNLNTLNISSSIMISWPVFSDADVSFLDYEVVDNYGEAEVYGILMACCVPGTRW